VDGTLLYPFGRAPGPDQTLTSWQGIGIEAPAGTPVRAVAAGVVKLVDTQLATFGATVVILHPSGEYSIYSSLGSITVGQDQIVDRGTQIGTVGSNDPRLPPHLHFEIRSGSRPIAVDPLTFLRARP
jgi:murein DD-endopeptidase MepM/ murein hydrolase activator NlpD